MSSKTRRRRAMTSRSGEGIGTQDVLRDAFQTLLMQARSQAIHGGQSAQVSVTPEFAMNISTVHDCVRIVSGSLAQLPIRMYERGEAGGLDQIVKDHPIAEFLRAPAWCPWMTRFDQVALLAVHLLLWGNAYAEMVWERGTGHPVEMLPQHPATVEPQWSDRYLDRRGRKKLVYQIRESGQTDIVFDGDLLAFRRTNTNGIRAPHIGEDGGQTLALEWHSEKIAVDFCTKNAKPSIVVKVPGMIPSDKRPGFLSDLRTQHSSGEPLVLEYGSEAATLDIPFSSAQLLDSRKYQGRKIASRFGVMPHQLGDTDGAKYDNVEALDNNYVKYTLVPLLLKITQEFARKLLTAEEQVRYYFEFNVDALLRGAQPARYAAYQTSVGWQKVNEIRAKENLAPIPGPAGEALYQTQIIAPVAEATGQAASPVVETPPPEAMEPEMDEDIETEEDGEDVQANVSAVRERYLRLSRNVIEALLHGEVTQLRRSTRSPSDFQSALQTERDRLQKKLAERFGHAPHITRAVQSRYDQLARCLGESDLPAAVEMCLSGLSSDPLVEAVTQEK